MLEGIAANPIIVGAYANQDGVCPMLAAHRAGGRTSLISFARAWDRFAFRDARKARARRATERELRVLKTYLEASMLDDDAPSAGGTGLTAVRQHHQELQRRRRTAEAQKASSTRRANREAEGRARHRPSQSRPGDPDRSHELGGRAGWSWTRLFRRYDDYELALARLEDERREAESVIHPRKPGRSSPEGALTR
jgi:hypothetical protein